MSGYQGNVETSDTQPGQETLVLCTEPIVRCSPVTGGGNNESVVVEGIIIRIRWGNAELS